MRAYTVEYGTDTGELVRYTVIPHVGPGPGQFGVVVFGEIVCEDLPLPAVVFSEHGFETSVDALRAAARFVAVETAAATTPPPIN